MIVQRSRRPGAALVALTVILVITAAWWGIALWPVGTAEPEWVARTRAACFGAMPGGLPDAGGWILLIGEPIGMLGVLVAVWGRALREELAWIRGRGLERFAAGAMTSLAVVWVVTLAVRVARASTFDPTGGLAARGTATRLDLAPPASSFVDQHGERFAFADLRGRRALVTFAYGHCTTVCPATVDNLRIARRRAGRGDVALVVLTVDPWRDTPERLPTIAQHWGLAPGDRVLSGSIAEVERALDQFGVGRQRDGQTGDVVHATTTMIMEESGRIGWRVDGGWDRVAELLARPR